MKKILELIFQHTNKFEKFVLILLLLINTSILIRLIFKFTLSASTFFLFFSILILLILIKKLRQTYPKKKILNIFFNVIIAFTLIWGISFTYIQYKLIQGYKYDYLKNKYDTIIVLGSGLRKGNKLSSTLKSRLDKTLEVYKVNSNAKIITSGGKGSDELLSEALAMKNYLVKNKVPSNKIFIENKSTSTYENLLFSKKLIKTKNIKTKNIALITSDYHTHRAGLFAKFIKLKVNSISSKTPVFPRLFSSIREYYAVATNYVFY